MKVLVTGGSGFIGSFVVERLLARGDEVVLLGDFSLGLPDTLSHLLGHKSLHLEQGDIRDPSTVDRIASEAEATIHLAAIVGEDRVKREPGLAFAVNVAGTMNALEGARRHSHSRFVFSSSVATYGPSSSLSIGEESEQRPISIYGATKLVGERLVEGYRDAFGLCATSLRFFSVYGPRERSRAQSAVFKFAGDAVSSGAITVKGDGSEIRDFVFVEDVADAVLLALDSKAEGAFNVGSGRGTSIGELAEMLVRFLPGLKVLHGEKGFSFIVSGAASIEKASGILGWRPRTELEDGLMRCIEFAKSAGKPQSLR